MKAIDQYGMPLRRNTRRKTKQPSNVMFKLRDPVTGLFWGVSPAKDPLFNHVGKQWGSRAGAMANWAEYNFQRVVEDDSHPRELELVEYELKVTEKRVTADQSPNMTVPALFAVTYKLDYDLNKFVKKLALDGYPFTHIIKCERTGEDFPIPPHVKFRYQFCPLNGWTSQLRQSPGLPRGALNIVAAGTSGRRPGQAPKSSQLPRSIQDAHYIAVGTETDMIFLRMALSDHIVAIWDIDKMIAGEQHSAYLSEQ